MLSEISQSQKECMIALNEVSRVVPVLETKAQRWMPGASERELQIWGAVLFSTTVTKKQLLEIVEEHEYTYTTEEDT